MSEVTYYFNAKGTDVWSDAAKIIDNILTNYAYTAADVIQLVTGNSCPGTNLGDITKVELRVYGYGDGDDRIDLTPVFGGSDDGDKHQTTPGVSPGSWGEYQDISRDTNAPGMHEKNLEIGSYEKIYGGNWFAQTFTPGTAHSVDFVDLKLYREGSSGDLTISIKATDRSGHPTGNDLTLTTINEADLAESPEWVRCLLPSYALTQGTKYAIVLRAIDGDSTNYIYLSYEGSNVYANGNYENSVDSGWNWTADANRDFTFTEGVCLGFTDIQALNCKVEKDTVSKGNQMNCAKVEIRVTYTSSVGGVTRSHGYIF